MTKDRQKAVYTATQGQELILLSLPRVLQIDDHIVLGNIRWQKKNTEKSRNLYLFFFPEYCQLIFPRKQRPKCSLGFTVKKKEALEKEGS